MIHKRVNLDYLMKENKLHFNHYKGIALIKLINLNITNWMKL